MTMSRVWPYIAAFLLGIIGGVLMPQGCNAPELAAPPLLQPFINTQTRAHTVPMGSGTAQPAGRRVIEPRVVIPEDVSVNPVRVNLAAIDTALSRLQMMQVEMYYETWFVSRQNDSIYVRFDYINRRFDPIEFILADRETEITERTVVVPAALQQKNFLERPEFIGPTGIVLGLIVGILITDNNCNNH